LKICEAFIGSPRNATWDVNLAVPVCVILRGHVRMLEASKNLDEKLDDLGTNSFFISAKNASV
jgi:hypothetical protein